MSITVRRAVPDDAPAMLAILTESAREVDRILTRPEEVADEATERELISEGRPGLVLLVAQRGGAIVGVCGFQQGERAGLRHTADVGITVRADARGQGVGARFMLAAENDARALGVRRPTLGVFAHNERARRLYLRLGYVEEGVQRRHVQLADGRLVDLVLMAKEIGG